MGVLNRTPDSFSDGGVFMDFDTALHHAEQMARDGAAIIDIGGESTRPGAEAVSAQEEMDRVVPLIERLRREIDIPVSIDTSKPEVMRAAVAAGAGMINDVYALRQPGALDTAAQLGVPIVLMHMQGEPRSMQHNPHYRNVVAEVGQFLSERVHTCEAAGIARERLLVDPGFGFGKTLEHNLEMLRGLHALADPDLPVVVGLSRKSSIGKLLGGVPARERVYGSVAAAVIAVLNGASIVRAHDVKPTVEALKVAAAVRSGGCYNFPA
ncbi:MAG TPA: dihydropteroate synthase [Gammaproteobacteria bacterium]|nr:dihydropteroate synthase [Gammaproteobacteria bacterium]